MKVKYGGFACKGIQCSVCGRLTAGRLPRSGRHKGDGTLWYPRRHKVNGKDCPGNISEGIVINKINPTP